LVTPLVVVVVLGSALLHASWNALLKSETDRLWSIAMMGAASATIALPIALMLPAPDRASWPFLATSAVVQITYCFALVRAYDHGDLAQVYPIARGSSPMLVTLGAAFFVDERLKTLAIAGVILVSLGIVGQVLGRGALHRSALIAALLTGSLIACYTVIDGVGSRASHNAISYALWLFVLQGAPMPLLYRIVRGGFPKVGRDVGKSIGGALASSTAYGAVVWAMSQSPMGATSALRETSVLFAALLGRLLLKERLTAVRAIACIAIAAGAVCLGMR
jgi:drug/metabolite transporter (DMT)-like permease